MRFNDVASDIAFLVMDLDYQGAVAASMEMLEAFARRYGDLRLLALVDFYLCYRACVRLKVTCFRLRQEGLEEDLRRMLLERTRTFAALACRYAVRFAAPTVYVVMGMIASGKSTVAAALADALDLDLLGSDRIRKRLFRGRSKKGPEASYGDGIYRPEARSHVYGNLLLEAEDRLRDRRSVVLDATFSRRKQRTEALRLARDVGARIVFVECRCPESEIKRRLKSRENGTGLSDARLSIWEQFQERYEAPEEIPPPLRVQADTTRPTPDLIPGVFVASRQAAASADALYNFDDFL
jgi:predicted kinase